jgi:hypothetical protein
MNMMMMIMIYLLIQVSVHPRNFRRNGRISLQRIAKIMHLEMQRHPCPFKLPTNSNKMAESPLSDVIATLKFP